MADRMEKRRAPGLVAAILALGVAAAPVPAVGQTESVAPPRVERSTGHGAGAAAIDGARGRTERAAETSSDTTRAQLLSLWARAYFPGRSGDVMTVPERGVIITGQPGPRFMHGSPWDYDAEVPLLAYGKWVGAGEVQGDASHQDVGATLADLVGLPPLRTTAGSSLLGRLGTPAPAAGTDGTDASPAADEPRGEGPAEDRPGIVALLVLDGFRTDFFRRYADSLPTLRRLRREGAWFPDARLDVLPSATSVAHANLSTGTVPAVHGVTGNTLFDRRAGQLVTTLGGPSPERLFSLTVSDRWAEATGGQAVVYAQGGTDYPSAALAGHGACLFGGRPVFAANFEGSSGGWTTNPECYTLPESLADDRITALIDSVGGAWLGHGLSSPYAARATALFARFEGRAATEALESLPFGRDTIADLYLVNLKTTDYAGHAFGPESPEMEAIVGEVDRQVGRIVETLERRAGERGFTLFLTADHGMPSEPDAPGLRLSYEHVMRAVQREFDTDGQGLVRALDGADNQLYLDRDRLAELGVSPARVAEFLESLPYIRAAFSADEVARAAAELAESGSSPR